MKRNVGITLIALVVTVVVLMILAGISITMLTGDNGLINMARQAKEATEETEKKEMSELKKINNVAPQIVSVDLEDKTTNSIMLKVIATDEDEDELTYRLVAKDIKTKEVKKSDEIKGKQNTEIILTVNGLSEYTDYKCHVEVFDEEFIINKSTNEETIRTYCPGTGIECEGPFKTEEKCTACNGKGDACGGNHVVGSQTEGRESFCGCANCGGKDNKIDREYTQTCKNCGAVAWAYRCNDCGWMYNFYNITTKGRNCSTCNGTGKQIIEKECDHHMTETHQYCSHNRTEQHDD